MAIDLQDIRLNVSDKSALCKIATALSSPERLDIIAYLYNYNSATVQKISQQLNLPFSSTSNHIKKLEESGIVATKKQTIEGKSGRLCWLSKHFVTINLRPNFSTKAPVQILNIPIGSYSDFKVVMPGGLVADNGYIGAENDIKSFYNLDKTSARLIWITHGYLEYAVPNTLPDDKTCKRLTISMEICSEYGGYREDFLSDIYLHINGKNCGFHRSLGDYGARKGILNPDFWSNGVSQYGKLVKWEVDETGTYIQGQKVSDVTITDLNIENYPCIKFKIVSDYTKPPCGGFNLFGRGMGDYNQDIVMTLEY